MFLVLFHNIFSYTVYLGITLDNVPRHLTCGLSLQQYFPILRLRRNPWNTFTYPEESLRTYENEVRSKRWQCVTQFSNCHIILTYLLTPWSRVLLEKLTGFAASQEIPRILWNNPTVHYRTATCDVTTLHSKCLYDFQYVLKYRWHHNKDSMHANYSTLISTRFCNYSTFLLILSLVQRAAHSSSQ